MYLVAIFVVSNKRNLSSHKFLWKFDPGFQCKIDNFESHLSILFFTLCKINIGNVPVNEVTKIFNFNFKPHSWLITKNNVL